MLRMLSEPMKAGSCYFYFKLLWGGVLFVSGVPAFRICEKLKKADAQICELRYEKDIEVNTMDFKKARVKDLKLVLQQWGEKCNGCSSKQDYINRIEELKPKHAPSKDL